MKNYLYAIVFLIIFTSGLHAQCKRGEQLRITNDVEIKIDKLSAKFDKHIDFIDDTYEGLKNPIKMATRFFKKW